MSLTKEDLQAISNLMDAKLEPAHENLSALNKRIAVIEVNHGKKLDAVLDSQKSSNERLDRMQSQVDSLERKLDNSVVVKAVAPTISV